MIYLTFKIIHIISASILFGTGLGTALYMLIVNSSNNIALIAKATRQVVLADWIFTFSSGVVQALTGFVMIYLKGYQLSQLWIVGSIIGYVIAGCCWLPVVWLQIQCRDIAHDAMLKNQSLPSKYYRYYRSWYLLGIPAFIALLIVYYLMVNKIKTF